MSKRGLPLGARVVAHSKLMRGTDLIGQVSVIRRVWKIWSYPNELLGIFIGYRTYYNGKVEWGGEDVGNVFAPDETVAVALVVPNTLTNPIPFPVAHVELETVAKYRRRFGVVPSKKVLRQLLKEERARCLNQESRL